MYKYILIDKNNLVGPIYESSKLEKVMHQLLTIIESHLRTISSLNIQVNSETLNFDNYKITKVKTKKRHNPIIVDVYNFSIQNGFTSNENAFVSNDLKYTITQVTNLWKSLNTNSKTGNFVSKPVTQQEKSIVESKPSAINFDKTNTALRQVYVPPEIPQETFETKIVPIPQEEDKNIEIQEKPKQFSLTKQRTQKPKKQKQENAKKTKYEADKRAYYMMKEDIASNKLSVDKMSVLFVEKYPIFEYLDEIDVIDNEDAYLEYEKLYDELYNDEFAEPDVYQPIDDILKQLDTDDPVIIRKQEQKDKELNLIQDLEEKESVMDFFTSNTKSNDITFDHVEDFTFDINN